MEPPPDSTPDMPLIENGKPCESSGQCKLGNCVKGICCNTSCDQACFSCNVMGLEGICAPVPNGQVNANDCAVEAPSTCGRDGTCDGRGQCRRYQENTECAPVSCTDGVERAASRCDGNGMCKPSTMTKSCAPMTCKGSTCASNCDATTPCQPGAYCDATQHCAPLLMNGQACTDNNQCASTHCVEGVCCNTDCTQKCFSCKVTSPTDLTGTCSPAAAGTDPRTECPAQDPTTCGRAGGCDGTANGTCRLHPNTTPCSPQSCTGSTQTAASLCNGLGTCLAGAQTDCGNYLCNTTTNSCRTTCANSNECKAGLTCMGTSCVPSLPGPVLYWKFDETSGTTAMDSSGNNFHGSSMGITGATATPLPSMSVPTLMFTNPRSLEFTASQRTAMRVAMPPAPSPLRPTVDVTLSAWYRANDTDIAGENGGEIASGGNSYLIRVRATYMEVSKRIAGKASQCFSPTVSAAQAKATFLNGNWHHLVGVSSAQGLKLYYDGTLVCDESTADDKANIAYDQGSDFFVGRHGNGQGNWDFGGNVDEVRMYNRALSEAEIVRLSQGHPF
jgi:hypothetical protein